MTWLTDLIEIAKSHLRRGLDDSSVPISCQRLIALGEVVEAAKKYDEKTGCLLDVFLGKSWASSDKHYVARCDEAILEGQKFREALTRLEELE